MIMKLSYKMNRIVKYISAEYNISHFFNGIPPYGSLLVLVNSPSKIIVPTGIGKC